MKIFKAFNNSAMAIKKIANNDQNFNATLNGSEGRIKKNGDQTTLFAGGGSDIIKVKENADHSVTVTINGEKFEFTEEEAKNLTIDAGDGNDKVVVSGDTGVTINGGAGDDIIRGGDGDDVINGGTGNDILEGGAGDDHIDGGAGNDTMKGGTGDDSMMGGLGNDKMYGNSGNDIMDGGHGSDVVKGGWGDDIVDGGPASFLKIAKWADPTRDVVDGGPGNDIEVNNNPGKGPFIPQGPGQWGPLPPRRPAPWLFAQPRFANVASAVTNFFK